MPCDPRFGGFEASCETQNIKVEKKRDFSRCSIVWSANKTFGLIYFILFSFMILFYLPELFDIA